MANVSRNVPPCAAVITIRPAAGGPSSTTFHSSGEKEALFVMSRSCAPRDAGHDKNRAVPGHALHPAGVRNQALAEDARFELARACTQHAFQACALGH